MPTSAIHIDTNSTTMENRFIVKAICYLLYFPRRKNDNLIIIVCGIEMYDRELLQINTPEHRTNWLLQCVMCVLE